MDDFSKLNLSFSHPMEPLLDDDAIVSDFEEPKISFNDYLNIQSLTKDQETLDLVYKNLTKSKESEPNYRELNDILYKIDLDDIGATLMKKKVLQTIDDELYLHEQVDVRLQVEKIKENMQYDQKRL